MILSRAEQWTPRHPGESSQEVGEEEEGGGGAAGEQFDYHWGYDDNDDYNDNDDHNNNEKKMREEEEQVNMTMMKNNDNHEEEEGEDFDDCRNNDDTHNKMISTPRWTNSTTARFKWEGARVLLYFMDSNTLYSFLVLCYKNKHYPLGRVFNIARGKLLRHD